MIDIGGSFWLLIAIVFALLVSLVKIVTAKKISMFHGLYMLAICIFTVAFSVSYFFDPIPEPVYPTHYKIEKPIAPTHGSAEIIEIDPDTQGPIQLGLDISRVRSAPPESAGISYCSKTARITLRSLTREKYARNHGDGIPQGNAMTLIEEGITAGTITKVSFDDKGVNPSQELFEMLAFNELEVADVYLYRPDPKHGKLTSGSSLRNKYMEQGHRFVVVLGHDGILYALDPYRGGVGSEPQLLSDYVKLIDGWTMYVGSLYEANVDLSVITIYERGLRKQPARIVQPSPTIPKPKPTPKPTSVMTEPTGSVSSYIQEKNTISVSDFLKAVGEKE